MSEHTLASIARRHHFNPGDTAYIVDHIYETNAEVRVIAADSSDFTWVQIGDAKPFLAASLMLHREPETVYGIADADMQAIDALVAAEPPPHQRQVISGDVVRAAIAEADKPRDISGETSPVTEGDILTDKLSAFEPFVEAMDGLDDGEAAEQATPKGEGTDRTEPVHADVHAFLATTKINTNNALALNITPLPDWERTGWRNVYTAIVGEYLHVVYERKDTAPVREAEAEEKVLA